MKPTLSQGFTRFARLVATCAVAVLLAACGPKLTPENLAKVHNGMTTAEVRAILGTPTETGTREVPILGKLDRMTYRQGSSEVNLLFRDDRLEIKSGELRNP